MREDLEKIIRTISKKLNGMERDNSGLNRMIGIHLVDNANICRRNIVLEFPLEIDEHIETI